MAQFLFLLSALIIAIQTLNAQTIRKRTYDSLIVGDKITPAVSSILMPRSFTEIILANGLISSNTFFNSKRNSLNLNERYTYLINTLQITRGISPSGRVNIGVEISYRTGRNDIDPNSSPLKVFGGSSEGLIRHDRSFTSLGLKVRFNPLANNINFVIQNTFYIPINASSQSSIFLGDNRYAFNTQFFYTKFLGGKTSLFGQADLFVRFKDSRSDLDFIFPLNIYASYMIRNRFFPFLQIGMSNSWNKEFNHERQSFHYGGGIQYQISTMANINAFYSDIFSGKNTSSARTYNIGFRVVI